MTKEQKRYTFVFTGLFLMILGGILYLNHLNNKKNLSDTNVKTRAEVKIRIENSGLKRAENIFIPYTRPTKLNYIYGENVTFVRGIPSSQGTIEYTGDKYINNLRVVCGGPNCSRQVVTRKKSSGIRNWQVSKKSTMRETLYNMTRSYNGENNVHINTKKRTNKKVKVIRGNIEITKGKVEQLKPNTKIIGNLYIRNVNFLRIPENFIVDGDVYIIDSEGITFVGDSRVNGQIYVYGKSSIKSVPSSVKISGQIFV